MSSWARNQLAQTLAALLIIVGWSEYAAAAPNGNQPEDPPGLVDLGYAKHIPSYVNTTLSGKTNLTIYKNIRFANAPTGDLRFRKPNTQIPRIDDIQDGLYPEKATECIASAPAYAPFPGLNGTTWGHEDCLFLDIWVPEGVKPGDKIPVLHWVFGSGYAFGSKDRFLSPIGLYDRMGENDKFIYVANNYRLGIPGWTSVPGQDMDANVGLYDSLAAGRWISQFIERFGGDPNRVTAMGQSAGAGILELLTTLDSGATDLPFQQVFISSPDLPPRGHNTTGPKRLFKGVLNATGCDDLACLRSVSEDVIIKANEYLVNGAPAESGGGVFGPGTGFGPVLDGKSFPETPIKMFQNGWFNQGLKALIVGNMAEDGHGLAFDEGMPGNFPFLVRQLLPGASNATVANIQALYQNLSQPEELAWDWTTDAFYQCNAYNLAEAYQDRARQYLMTVPPATHTLDEQHYFYVDQELTPVPNRDIAFDFQDRLIRFINGRDCDWPIYGKEERMYNITTNGFEADSFAGKLKERCDVINKILLDPNNGL